jgi:transcriptional regulator with PAS, ATPase and Fis domain
MPKAKTPEARALSALADVNVQEFENRVREAIKGNNGNIAKTAKDLGISLRCIWRWIEKNPRILIGSGHVSKRDAAKDSAELDT